MMFGHEWFAQYSDHTLTAALLIAAAVLVYVAIRADPVFKAAVLAWVSLP